MPTGEHVVLVERHGPTAVVTLNRPGRRNAVNGAVADAMGAALREIEDDRSVRVSVLTGAGDMFCAGADLKEIDAGRDGEILRGPYGFAGFVRFPRTKPAIAAVNGHALAGGTELVLACDLAVAARSARFGLPEVKRGIFAGAGGAIGLPQRVGRKRAMELLLTGDPITATTAERWGLINAVVDDGAALDAALELAGRVAVNAPASLRETLALADASGDLDTDQRWAANEAAWQRITATADAAEGPRAFAEKRAAIWRDT
jgi:enoyl-CoA hydratase/carnithine racemase